MKEEIKTPRGRGYGFLESDVDAIRRFMKGLGWTETHLAKEAALSQQQVNRFLNGKRKLSAAASDRVADALHRGRLAKGGLERLMQLKNDMVNARSTDGEENVYDPDLEDPTAPPSVDNLVVRGDLLEALSGPPRDRAAYEGWKTRQLERLSAVEELEAARGWIKEMEARNAALVKERDQWKESASLAREIISSLEDTNSNAKEVIALHKAWVSRLQKQLVEAGMTPTD